MCLCKKCTKIDITSQGNLCTFLYTSCNTEFLQKTKKIHFVDNFPENLLHCMKNFCSFLQFSLTKLGLIISLSIFPFSNNLVSKLNYIYLNGFFGKMIMSINQISINLIMSINSTAQKVKKG